MKGLWKWYALVLVGLIVLSRVTGGTTQAIMGVVLLVALVTATVVGIRMHKPADRVTWYFILANQVLFLLGNLLQYVLQDVLKIRLYPSPADALFVMTYAALIVALLRILRTRFGGVADRASALDAIVITAGACVATWHFWAADALRHDMPVLARITLASYPILDLTVFMLAVRTLLGRGAKPFALKLLCATLFTLAVTDVIAGWQTSRGVYTPHNWLDVPWGFCTVFAAAMALHPSMARIAEATQSEPRLRSTRVRLFAMAGASAVAPMVLALSGLDDHDLNEIVIAFFAIVMFAGVVGRAYLSSLNDARTKDALLAKQEELANALNVLKATEHERSQLLDSVIRAGERERVWVAAELHDGPIQQLSALGFSIDRVRRRLVAGDTLAGARSLEQTRDELTRVVSGLRKLMSELRPPALDESGLVGALSDYVAAFRRDAGLECELIVDLGDERLPSELETTLYRVAQESLQNIRRHAQAEHAEVALSRTNGIIRLRVHDDGRGFDTRHNAVDGEHYGLIGMRERVEQRGGRWRVQSDAGAGTTIDAEFPVFGPDPANSTAHQQYEPMKEKV